MQRVVAVMDTWAVSGPARQLVALAERLPEVGFDLFVLTFVRGTGSSPFEHYLRARHIPHEVVRDSGTLDLRVLGRMRRALGGLDPSIVQTHSYRPTALNFALRATGIRRPWVAFFHGRTAENRRIRWYNRLESAVFPFADRLVLMSHAEASRFDRMGSRVRVIYNAVLAAPHPDGGTASAQLRAMELLPRPRVGVAARLSSEKGVGVFLEAVGSLRQRGVELSVLIAGSGPELDRYRTRVTQLGLETTVRFLGRLGGEIRVFYDLLDLLVIPSLSEGLPNVLLEAVAADLPIVATAVGAIPEVVGNTGAAVLVPPNDPGRLAAAIQSTIGRQRETGSRARRELAERLSLDRRVHEHVELYHELLGHVPPTSVP